jgi:hypothetical protein
MPSPIQENNPGTNNSDKRYFPRWEVTNRVTFRLDGQEDIRLEAKTKDLSCAGACILTQQKIPEDQKLKLVIELADGSHIRVNGRSVWSRFWEKNYEIGISFLDSSDKMRELILENAYELNQNEIYQHWFKGWHGQNNPS